MAKKKTSIGCLFWVALLTLVIVVFLFTWPQVSKVLKETGFFSTIMKPGEKKLNVVKDKEETSVNDKKPQDGANTPKTEEKVVTVDDKPAEVEKPKTETPSTTTNNTIKPAESKPTTTSSSVSDKKSRNSVLYFVSVDESSKISMRAITRKVLYDDSPLTETLQVLLKGLTSKEISDGMISLIPENTKLLGVSIKGEIVYLNFNEAFRYNQVGKEGFIPQLKQVVYTATEFSNVKQVQILIEGVVSTYLGAEGIKIDKPLTRAILDKEGA